MLAVDTFSKNSNEEFDIYIASIVSKPLSNRVYCQLLLESWVDKLVMHKEIQEIVEIT